MAADDTSAAHFAVGRDDDFNFDLASNAHPLGELGIGWRGLALNFALAFIRVRLLCDHKSGSKQSGCCRGDTDSNPTRSHGHYSSLQSWSDPGKRKARQMPACKKGGVATTVLCK